MGKINPKIEHHRQFQWIFEPRHKATRGAPAARSAARSCSRSGMERFSHPSCHCRKLWQMGWEKGSGSWSSGEIGGGHELGRAMLKYAKMNGKLRWGINPRSTRQFEVMWVIGSFSGRLLWNILESNSLPAGVFHAYFASFGYTTIVFMIKFSHSTDRAWLGIVTYPRMHLAHCLCPAVSIFWSTLWWTNILLWKITIFHGKIHYFYGHFQLQTVSSPEGMCHMPMLFKFIAQDLQECQRCLEPSLPLAVIKPFQAARTLLWYELLIWIKSSSHVDGWSMYSPGCFPTLNTLW